MTLALVGWLLCTTIGLVLVDLDVGPRLVSLTMGHGLTVTDAAAVAVLLAGWFAPVVTARRRRVDQRLPVPARSVSAIAAIATGSGLLTAALLTPDFSGRKFVVAALALVVEVAAAAAVLARPRANDR